MQSSTTIVAAITFLVCAQLLSFSQSQAQIVFDNTTDLTGSTSFGPGCCLSGTQIMISQPTTLGSIDWVLSGQSPGVEDADILFAIHANDGVDGSPNTLLWDQTFTDLAIAPGLDFYTFEIPGIDVVQDITVTSRVLSSSPIATGFAISQSTDVGQTVANWSLFEGQWGQTQFSTRAFRLNAQAIPEPSGAGLLLLTAALLSLRSRRM